MTKKLMEKNRRSSIYGYNKHIGNLLAQMSDKDVKEVLEQYAYKLGYDIYKTNNNNKLKFRYRSRI